MRFLDSWLHAPSAGYMYRVGVVYPNISGIKSNNWVYLKKKINFLCANPLTVLRVFWDAFCVHPCGFRLEKSNIDETIGGESFVGF
jgi:hypothetical protein